MLNHGRSLSLARALSILQLPQSETIFLLTFASELLHYLLLMLDTGGTYLICYFSNDIMRVIKLFLKTINTQNNVPQQVFIVYRYLYI